ncbi:MAG: class I SAM-dependent methyltransferase [Candidatus Moranbacteria bacterium]|nr:class I SAM-dependent methyltransferase [Candidatus Moranbacteria bacterium]
MYSQEYFTRETTKSGEVFPAYLSFLATLGVSLKEKKVLDVGCATGEFIGNIERTSTCYGCDYSEYAVKQCQEKFPHIKDRFFQMDLNQGIFPLEESFDVITMFDVVEHLTNFVPLEQILQKHLKKGGLLIVTTPNANSLTRFLGSKNFTGEVDPTHRMLFTPYTMDFFLRRVGLSKKEMFTPYIFHFKMNFLTRRILFGGQIVAIYSK